MGFKERIGKASKKMLRAGVKIATFGLVDLSRIEEKQREEEEALREVQEVDNDSSIGKYGIKTTRPGAPGSSSMSGVMSQADVNVTAEDVKFVEERYNKKSDEGPEDYKIRERAMKAAEKYNSNLPYDPNAANGDERIRMLADSFVKLDKRVERNVVIAHNQDTVEGYDGYGNPIYGERKDVMVYPTEAYLRGKNEGGLTSQELWSQVASFTDMKVTLNDIPYRAEIPIGD